ncbi:MAG: hypothetical protein IPK70_13890 [Flavobacteriales bacterium]|jgi:uncharacterized protein YycO|nr:hypothetical protein [Flavobacteriales bacterium]
MERRWWIGLVALVVLAVVLWRAFSTEGNEAGGSGYLLSDAEMAELQPGDIILRRGHGLVSDLISSVLSEEYDVSHCGIVAEHDSALWVIHSVSSSVSEADGMQSHRLQSFVGQSKPGSVIVTRLRTAADRSLIARRAKELLRRKVPFDHDFDLEDTTRIYCSELVWRIIRDDYGIDVFDAPAVGDKAGRYRFMRLLDTARFEVILNHQKH